jgi:drug/metabolite transporter (DMT)-like permease
VVLSALCFASLNILAQLAYRVGVPAGTLASARFLLAAAVFWPLALGLRRRLPRRRDAIVALAVGLVYSAASELLFESLTQTKAALVDLLFFTYPALVVAAASLSGRESWTARRAFSVCISLVGSLLVLGGGLSGLHATGAAFALAAAGLYAVYVLLSSNLLARVDALVLVALVSTGAAGGTTGAGIAIHQLRVPHGAEPVVLVAAVAFVSAVVGIGSFIAGVARLGPSRASIVSTAEPILTAALALLCFGDRLGPIQLGGGALVLSAIVVLERRPAPDKRGHALVLLPAHRPADLRMRALPKAIVVRVAEPSDVPALERLTALRSSHSRAARSLSPTSSARRGGDPRRKRRGDLRPVPTQPATEPHKGGPACTRPATTRSTSNSPTRGAPRATGAASRR